MHQCQITLKLCYLFSPCYVVMLGYYATLYFWITITKLQNFWSSSWWLVWKINPLNGMKNHLFGIKDSSTYVAYSAVSFIISWYLTTNFIITSNHMFERAVWDKLPQNIFEHFEIAQVKQGLFQNFQKLWGWFIPKITRTKHVITG